MAKAMQRVLMVDNYDSFTFNIVQYLGELNAEVMTYRNDEITLAQMEALAPSHLVISPGPCTPNEAGVSLAAIEHFAGRLPILGFVWVIRPSGRYTVARWCALLR